MEPKRVAGSLAFSLALLAFSCDSGSASTQPGLGTTGSGGSSGTSSGSGGSSGSGVSGSAGSSAGTSSTGGSGVGGSGTGGSATGGSTGAGGTSSTGVELVNPDGWVGGDPAVTTDNPLGIQGAWYGYGDGTSCADQQGLNPCSAGGCCISGHTIIDSTFAAWGCGLGLSLNASGGDASIKSAYTGTARSFTFTITGTTGGQPLRIGFTQSADTTGKVSPYKEIPSFSTGTTATVTFADATYPSWCQGNAACDGLQGTSANPASSYDIQVQIPGGVAAADYNFCITSLTVSP